MQISRPLVVALALVSGGCAIGIKPDAQYRPAPASAPAILRTVSLRVVDARDPKKGGIEKALVGQARGGYGNPFGVREVSSDRVASNIWAATSDALRMAGIDVKDGSSNTIVATIRSYWADGYATHKFEIDVAMELQASDGRTVWNASTRVDLEAKLGTKPKTRMKQGFEEILAKYAQSASSEFRSARFQAASGGSASASMAAAKLYNKDGSFFGDVVGTLGENVVVSLPTGVRATISLSQAAEMMAPQGATPPSPPPPPPPDLAIGMKLVTSDGRAFGTISSIEGDAVRVSLALGGSITITRAQAMERKPPAP